MKQLLAFALIFASATAGAADRNNRSERPRTLILQPGESGVFYDYKSRQNLRVECSSDNLPPAPPLDKQIVTIACDPYSNMLVGLNDIEGTKLNEFKIFMGSESMCSREKARILKVLDSGNLYQSTSIAFCDPYTNLIKIKFAYAEKTISKTEQTFSATDARCVTNADEFNLLFARPQ